MLAVRAAGDRFANQQHIICQSAYASMADADGQLSQQVAPGNWPCWQSEQQGKRKTSEDDLPK
jgi:hypothetical protein